MAPRNDTRTAPSNGPGTRPSADAVVKHYESRHDPRADADHGTVHRAGHPQNGSGFHPGGTRPGQTCDWYGDPLDGQSTAAQPAPRKDGRR